MIFCALEVAMAWAYSVDLRERVIAAFDAGDMTDEEVAALFKVGEATVHRWKPLKRETGALDLSGVRAMMTIEGATDGQVFGSSPD